jgi:DNA (cytosine-5)-methyltransferase 1
MRIGGLFSGIGGFERAFRRLKHETAFLCEVDDACRLVLRKRFDDARLLGDVRALRTFPRVDVLTAGFPCQDFSQAGMTAGIAGQQGSLFDEIIRLIIATRTRPQYVVLENVPFILHLKRGEAMNHIARSFEELGYDWAYRIVDTIGFGLPQRRRRWIFVASVDSDPRNVLFVDDSAGHTDRLNPAAFGFYWTEGNSGLGLAADAIPPLKVGSGFGIPASPAIWNRHARRIVTPAIQDAERLQGFPMDWTRPAQEISSRVRWKLVGNAVSGPTANWVASHITKPGKFDSSCACEMPPRGWPTAAYGVRGERRKVMISERPVAKPLEPIMDFLKHDPLPLSARAARGFLSRLENSTLRTPADFTSDLRHHIGTISRH